MAQPNRRPQASTHKISHSKTAGQWFKPSTACALTAFLISNISHAATLVLEATHQQTTGCSFTGSNAGALGLSSNFMELSTELAGGMRPSMTLTVVGSATLTLGDTVAWSRDQNPLPSVITQSLSLHSAARGSNKLSTPVRITQPGNHTFFLQTSGNSALGFFENGRYKATATLDCF